MRVFFLTVFCIAALCMEGCAIGVPLSESVMFHEPNTVVYDEKNNPHTPPSFKGGVMSTLSPTGKAADAFLLQKAASFPVDTTRFRVIDYQGSGYKLSAGTAFTVFFEEKAALGFNIGFPVLGADFTAKIADRTYFTVNLALNGIGEAIVQHKLFGGQSGMALGAFYRLEQYSGYEFFLPIPFPLFRLAGASALAQSFGVRVMGHIQEEQRHSAFLHATVSAGYSPELQSPTVHLGIVLFLKAPEQAASNPPDDSTPPPPSLPPRPRPPVFPPRR